MRDQTGQPVVDNVVKKAAEEFLKKNERTLPTGPGPHSRGDYRPRAPIRPGDNGRVGPIRAPRHHRRTVRAHGGRHKDHGRDHQPNIADGQDRCCGQGTPLRRRIHGGSPCPNGHRYPGPHRRDRRHGHRCNGTRQRFGQCPSGVLRGGKPRWANLHGGRNQDWAAGSRQWPRAQRCGWRPVHCSAS